jgi:hypothetical protein
VAVIADDVCTDLASPGCYCLGNNSRLAGCLVVLSQILTICAIERENDYLKMVIER